MTGLKLLNAASEIYLNVYKNTTPFLEQLIHDTIMPKTEISKIDAALDCPVIYL